MTEDRRKKQREYARRVYQKQSENLEKAFYKFYHITPKTNKEKVLKVLCKHWLVAAFEFGEAFGKHFCRVLNSRKHKKETEAWRKWHRTGLATALTLELKKAGVLPLPKGKAAQPHQTPSKPLQTGLNRGYTGPGAR